MSAQSNKPLSEQIKEARMFKRLTLKDMAEQVGVSESTFSRYESGKQSISFEQAQKIASVLDLTLKVTLE